MVESQLVTDGTGWAYTKPRANKQITYYNNYVTNQQGNIMYYVYKGNKSIDPNVPPERFPNRIPMNYGRYLWWPGSRDGFPTEQSVIAHARTIRSLRNGFMVYWCTNFKDASTFKLIHKEQS